jgi:hypothetical protein
MAEDLLTNIIADFFNSGWRVAPFIKTSEGYIGVKAWPKRAANNNVELQLLIEEQASKSSKVPILGIVPPPGRYIVDIDTKKNTSALQLWKNKVAEAYGENSKAEMPNLVVKTKSGGFHLYYSDGSEKQLHSPTSIFSKDSGVDIRGYTGMVIAPTSIGTVEDWQLGDYTIIKGLPTDPLTILGLSKILGDSYDEADTFIRSTLSIINECLRNDNVNELHRHRLIPDSIIVPSSNRDNTLYKCARLCRLANLSQDAAFVFMQHIATRCECTVEEPLEHWTKIAVDKVKRVYVSESELKLQTIAGLYEELDNAGTVLLRGVSKSYYYFRLGSSILRLDPRSKYSTDNIGNVLQGSSVHSDEGPIPVKKVINAYKPKEVAYNAAMYPKCDMPYFEYEGMRYVNTYHDYFSAFEPNSELYEMALPFVKTFSQLTKHIVGYNEDDHKHLLDKIAWIIQKPYRRLPTGTIIYSHTRGSGKDIFMGILRELIGRKYYMPITLKTIENAHTDIHDKIICTASEVQLQTNARGNIAAANFMGQLKDLITTKSVYINEKFVQPYSAPIFTNIFLLSNFELSSIIEPGDRRMDIFHAAEQKLDQEQFGPLADITNDGIWVERSSRDREFRTHIVYAIRKALLDRHIESTFDREEAKVNEVKQLMLDNQNPPVVDWMMKNLPPYFTDDVVMMACHFCPVRSSPEYMMKQLKEHFGTQMKQLRRSNTVYRMNGAPRLEKRSDNGSGSTHILNFETKSADPTCRRSVFFFDNSLRDATPNDFTLKLHMKKWYDLMIATHYNNVIQLPGAKPDALPESDLI